MDELGAELDRDRKPGQAAREAATPDPVPCFHQQDGTAGARQLVRGGKARRAGADNDDFRGRLAQAT